jgi:hypothetical protein
MASVMLPRMAFVQAVLAIALNPLPGLSKDAHSRMARSASAKKGAPASAIRKIPWSDRTYDFGDGQPCKFSNGNYSDLNDEGRCNVCMHIRAVTFGDIDADGQEEALVTVGTSLGGAGVMLEGFIYGLKDGIPVLRAAVEGGDRGEGGIESMKVEDGDVIVRRYQVDNSDVRNPANYGSLSHPNRFEIERWHWDGSKLVKISTRVIHRAPTPRVGPLLVPRHHLPR